MEVKSITRDQREFVFVSECELSTPGLAVVTVGQPMDTIKVKMQTFGHLYSGVGHCVRSTWASEGLRKGNY